MEIQYLSEHYAVSPQLAPADLAQLPDMGFSTVVCNRPDGEAAEQPTIEQMAQVARQHGLAFHAIPMSSPACSAEQVDELGQLLDQAPGKVLAYCRTGRRSSVIFQALQALQES